MEVSLVSRGIVPIVVAGWVGPVGCGKGLQIMITVMRGCFSYWNSWVSTYTGSIDTSLQRDGKCLK